MDKVFGYMCFVSYEVGEISSCSLFEYIGCVVLESSSDKLVVECIC